MPRKKALPPFLVVTVATEGKMLLTVVSDRESAQPTPTFGARVSLHTDARPAAIAVTLCELAAWLVRDNYRATEDCREAARSCIIAEGWFGNLDDDDDDDTLPF